jgi:hypothetical protein
MELVVVGAGVGRTGTHSLKVALEQLLDAPCHHMLEILGNPTQIPAWTDAIEGRPANWPTMLNAYRAISSVNGRYSRSGRRTLVQPPRTAGLQPALPVRVFSQRKA